MEKLIVPRLENLAFNAAFEEILINLDLCRDDRPRGKKLKTVAFSSALSLSPLFTSQSLIHFVRNRLAYFLEGPSMMSDKIRIKLVEKFNGHFSKSIYDNNVEPWLFMECVLNDTFQELEARVSLHHSEPDLKLIPTIAKQCAKLQKLKMDFSSIKELTEVDKVTPLITSLSSLEHLTSLNLYQLDSSHKSVLKLIGHFCPLLTHLSISGFHFSPKDVLSIILGEFADHLFLPHSKMEFPNSYSDEMTFSNFSHSEMTSWGLCRGLSHSEMTFLDSVTCFNYWTAPVEVLAPICSTLRHLKLGKYYLNEDFYYFMAVCFLLRHLPLLERMDGHYIADAAASLSTFEADRIGMMHDSLNQCDNVCKDFLASRSSTRYIRSNIGLSYPIEYKGSLSLTSLDYVDLHAHLLSNIPKICPHLKKVMFCMESTTRVSPTDVENNLKDWPKIETLVLRNILPEYAKVILEAFASSVKLVMFWCCRDINLMDLMNCSQLEFLYVSSSSSLDVTQVDPTRLSPSSFLPNLKSVESGICLNLWTLWLESKSELTHVVLNCFHNGTKASIHTDWISLSKMWPKVEVLTIRRCVGLTMAMVNSIVPQLTRLKDLTLPETIIKSDQKLAVEVWEDLNYRSVPVRLSFTKEPGNDCCLVGRGVEQLE